MIDRGQKPLTQKVNSPETALFILLVGEHSHGQHDALIVVIVEGNLVINLDDEAEIVGPKEDISAVYRQRNTIPLLGIAVIPVMDDIIKAHCSAQKRTDILAGEKVNPTNAVPDSIIKRHIHRYGHIWHFIIGLDVEY